MTSSKTVLVADESRAEILLSIAGKQHVIRFGLKFLKAFTTHVKGEGPQDALGRLESAPLDALLEMAALGIQVSVPKADLPEGFDADAALDVIDALPSAEQEAFFRVLVLSVKANPIIAALNSTLAAK